MPGEFEPGLSFASRRPVGLRCAYCHDGLEGYYCCEGCRTLIHTDCWSLGGGRCPTPGCEGGALPPRHEPEPNPARRGEGGLPWPVAIVCFLLFAVYVACTMDQLLREDGDTIVTSQLDLSAESGPAWGLYAEAEERREAGHALASSAELARRHGRTSAADFLQGAALRAYGQAEDCLRRVAWLDLEDPAGDTAELRDEALELARAEWAQHRVPVSLEAFDSSQVGPFSLRESLLEGRDLRLGADEVGVHAALGVALGADLSTQQRLIGSYSFAEGGLSNVHLCVRPSGAAQRREHSIGQAFGQLGYGLTRGQAARLLGAPTGIHGPEDLPERLSYSRAEGCVELVFVGPTLESVDVSRRGHCPHGCEESGLE